MAVTARTWVPGEMLTAVKMNTLRDDILELDAVAGFFNAQYGSMTFTAAGETTQDATVATMSTRAVIHLLGALLDGANSPMGVKLSKVNATTVRATRNAVGVAGSVTFVVEDPRG